MLCGIDRKKAVEMGYRIVPTLDGFMLYEVLREDGREHTRYLRTFLTLRQVMDWADDLPIAAGRVP